MLTVRIQEKNHSESIMVLKLKDGDHGISLAHGTSEIEICYADSEISHLLEVPEGEALLLTKNLVFNELNEPVHTCKNIINLSRYKMTIVS